MFTGYPWDIMHLRYDLWISIGHRVLLGQSSRNIFWNVNLQSLFWKKLALEVLIFLTTFANLVTMS